jgi:hypothetical protein
LLPGFGRISPNLGGGLNANCGNSKSENYKGSFSLK